MLFPASRLNQVPFIQDEDGRFSRLLNQSGDPFVLGRDTHRQIDDENAKISSANAAFGTHHAQNLSRAGNFPSPANSGGVDKNELQSVAFVHYVDGIACWAGEFANNGAFAAHDGGDKRRFTYIRPTDDRDRNPMLNVRSAFTRPMADKCWMIDVSRRGELQFDCVQ